MNTGAPNPGDILAGKYRVEKLLGVGAMGVVVCATHLGLGQRVALKFMLPTNADPGGQNERFLREARAASRLKTQHVAKILDVATLESGAPYIVMEMLDGRDLCALLAERGRLPFDEAVEHVLQACEAIGEAHAAGIVHRDIKPANLFLASGAGAACIKVLDFGVSKVTDEKHAMTRDGQALGSPLYMAPEQVKASKDVDGRADIWALGVTLYELVTGHPPFTGQDMQGLLTQIFFNAPPPLAQHRQDAPAGFEPILFQALEKERDRRYRNVADFAAAIAPFGPPRAAVHAERVAKILGVHVEPARPTDLLPPEPAAVKVEAPAAVPGATATAPAVSLQAPQAPAQQSRVGIIAALAVAVVALAVAVAMVVRGSGKAGEPKAASSTEPSAASSAIIAVAPSAPAPAVPARATAPTSAVAVVPEASASAPAPATLPAAKRGPTPPAAPAPDPDRAAPPKQPKPATYDDPN